MVLESLKKMMGKDKDKDKEDRPEPVLESPSGKKRPRRDDVKIPTTDDIPGMDESPDIPEPRGGRRPSRTPEERGEGLRRSQGETRERGTPKLSRSPQTGKDEMEGSSRQERRRREPRRDRSPRRRQRSREPESRNQSENRDTRTILNHLDRIEQRLADLDRRLAMLESSGRVRGRRGREEER